MILVYRLFFGSQKSSFLFSLDEPRPVETYANELITNIIKDASQAASQNPSENFDNTEMNNINELK
jgi:hypothetical protein